MTYTIELTHEDDGSLFKAGYVFATKKQAEDQIKKFEIEDRRNDCYEEDSYKIVEVEEFSESEEFTATIKAHGNSMTVNVTIPCRYMGLELGDRVRVTLNKIH